MGQLTGRRAVVVELERRDDEPLFVDLLAQTRALAPADVDVVHAVDGEADEALAAERGRGDEHVGGLAVADPGVVADVHVARAHRLGRETGAPDKGLTGSTGAGSGHWRLEFESEIDIEVLAYIRARHDGFLTSMHDLAPVVQGVHRVVFFNPGSNENQVSRLALVNPGTEDATVEVTGTDDDGASPGMPIHLTVPAGTVLMPSAAELESGDGEGIDHGALGDGRGKWRLAVTADQPILVMSLLENPTGHLSNLSTVPGRSVEGL